jgi:hypothetical protein
VRGRQGCSRVSSSFRSLGEREQDLDEIREGVRATFRPANKVEAGLCEDAVENWWRRRRVRRCETAQIRKAARGVDFLTAVDRDRDLSMAKEKFNRLIAERLQATPMSVSREVRRPVEIHVDLDAVRCDLRRSSFGLDFLRKTLDPVFAEASKNAVLSDTSEILLSACLGTSDENRTWAVYVNGIIKKGNGKGTKAGPPDDASAQTPAKDSQNQSGKADEGQPPAEEVRTWDEAALVACILDAQVDLALQASILRESETAVENDAQGRAAAFLTSSQLDRAETSYDPSLLQSSHDALHDSFPASTK